MCSCKMCRERNKMGPTILTNKWGEEVDSDVTILGRRKQTTISEAAEKRQRVVRYEGYGDWMLTIRSCPMSARQAWTMLKDFALEKGHNPKLFADGRILVTWNHGRQQWGCHITDLIGNEDLWANDVQKIATDVSRTFKAKLKPANKGPDKPEFESVMEPVDPDGPPTFELSPDFATNRRNVTNAMRTIARNERNRMHNIPNLDMGAPGNTMFNLKEYV